MPDYTWIQTVLEKWGAKNKAYDSDVDGVFDTGAIPNLDASKITSGVLDLARIPTIPRTKLEYPTEDVALIYLLCIGKAGYVNHNNDTSRWGLYTVDSFADKAIESIQIEDNHITCAGRRSAIDTMYMAYINTANSTADFILRKIVSGSGANIASESVDLSHPRYRIKLSISGSTLKGFREDMTTAKISATDTDIASGLWGGGDTGTAIHTNPIELYLRPVATPLPPAKAIIEVEITENGTNLAQLLDKHPELGDIDKYAVTWGAFDHKPEHNTMLITITSGNPYTGDKAIQEQIERAKSKNLKVLKPPRDYKEAVEQYRQLKQEFTEWIAGKDNYAYQTLGHEDFESFQVADTYCGNIVDGIKPNTYKNVPDWEMRKTLQMWKERLKRATIVKEEAEKHLKKIEEVEKKGW